MQTKQIVFTKENTAELLTVDYQHPKEDEVTVDLAFSAISAGTERANIVGVRNGTGVAEGTKPAFPRYLGYSASGVVSEVGSAVKSVAVGDRVIVFWGKHKKNITISERNVIKIPDGISFEEAALVLISIFPLAAIRKAKLEIGESAMVMGLGILGQFAVKELRAAGACPIIAVDPVQERRELALQFGADYALNPMLEDFPQTVKEYTDGGVNVCIEVTGLGDGLIQALDCMKRFGRVSLLGCTRSSKFEIDYYGKVHGPGISLIGAHTQARPRVESSPGLWTERDDIAAVLKLLENKRMSFDNMISEIHAPDEAGEVYDRLVNDRNFPIGVLFDWRK